MTLFLEALLYRRYTAKLRYELGFWSAFAESAERRRATTRAQLTAATGSATTSATISPTWTPGSTRRTTCAHGSARRSCARIWCARSARTGGVRRRRASCSRVVPRGDAPDERGGRGAARLRAARHGAARRGPFRLQRVIAYTFAGLPVAEYAKAYDWYMRFLGRPADMFPHATEAVWRVDPDGRDLRRRRCGAGGERPADVGRGRPRHVRGELQNERSPSRRSPPTRSRRLAVHDWTKHDHVRSRIRQRRVDLARELRDLLGQLLVLLRQRRVRIEQVDDLARLLLGGLLQRRVARSSMSPCSLSRSA